MAHLHNQLLPVGTRLGVYEIKEATVVDAFDITYLAWNHHLGDQVEILEYFPKDFAVRAQDSLEAQHKSPADKDNFDYGLKAFVEQAEILTDIEHPNIVQAETVLQLHGTAYLIKDHHEGATLAKLAQGPAAIADTELKYILAKLLSALEKAHEYNIVHGDIQPEAILLAKNGEPLLTNFVDARLAIAEHTSKLESELAAGYAPPELYEQTNKKGFASDFYALGATLYYCITQKQPSDAQARKHALNQGKPDPLTLLSDATDSPYSAELRQAIDSMLRLEYGDRPQSVSEILAVLDAAPNKSTGEQVASKQGSDEVVDSLAPAGTPIWLWGALGAIGLAALGFWLLQKPPGTNIGNTTLATSQPSLPSKIDTYKSTQVIKQRQTVNPPATPSIQKAEPTQPPEQAKSENKQPIIHSKPGSETKKQQASSETEHPKKIAVIEKAPIPASKATPQPEPVTKPKVKEKPAYKQKSDKPKKLAKAKPLPKIKTQNLVAKSNREGSIQGYLAAAKKAMNQRHLTQPPNDNAYKYYQMVLAKDPDNAEAQAGLNKIVNKYTWVIKESKAQGKLDKAKRVLKKAESVMPNSPNLERIRKELDEPNELY